MKIINKHKNHPSVYYGKTGVLILNLGTPNSYSWLDIRRYLKEFNVRPLIFWAGLPDGAGRGTSLHGMASFDVETRMRALFGAEGLVLIRCREMTPLQGLFAESKIEVWIENGWTVDPETDDEVTQHFRNKPGHRWRLSQKRHAQRQHGPAGCSH